MNNKSPFFSIIVPIYNMEQYLEECIDSLINQTFKDFEIILINDGSTDNSYNICKAYKNSNKNIILINQKNKGVSKARNEGIKKANGKYLYFVDGDDCLIPNALKIAYSHLYKTNIELLGTSNFRFTDDVNQRKNNILNPTTEILTPIEFLNDKNLFFHRAVCVFIVSSHLLNLNSIKFHEGIRLFEDELFCLTLIIYAKKIKFIDDCLYGYRYIENSRTRSKNYEKIMESFYILQKFAVENKYKNLSVPFWNERINYFTISFYRAFYKLDKNNQKKYTHLLNEIKRVKLEPETTSIKQKTVLFLHNYFFNIYKKLFLLKK